MHPLCRSGHNNWYPCSMGNCWHNTWWQLGFSSSSSSYVPSGPLTLQLCLPIRGPHASQSAQQARPAVPGAQVILGGPAPHAVRPTGGY